MRNVVSTAAFLALTSTAAARPPPMQLDHLIPEYLQPLSAVRLERLIIQDLPKGLRIFVFAELGGPFQPFGLGLKRSARGYDLIGVDVVGGWAACCGVPHKGPTYQCKTAIAKEDGDRIISTWDREVRRAHDDDHELPLVPDGMFAHYASLIGSKVVGGWSGGTTGMPRHFIDAVHRLHQMCSDDRGEDRVAWNSVYFELDKIH